MHALRSDLAVVCKLCMEQRTEAEPADRARLRPRFESRGRSSPRDARPSSNHIPLIQLFHGLVALPSAHRESSAWLASCPCTQARQSLLLLSRLSSSSSASSAHVSCLPSRHVCRSDTTGPHFRTSMALLQLTGSMETWCQGQGTSPRLSVGPLLDRPVSSPQFPPLLAVPVRTTSLLTVPTLTSTVQVSGRRASSACPISRPSTLGAAHSGYTRGTDDRSSELDRGTDRVPLVICLRATSQYLYEV